MIDWWMIRAFSMTKKNKGWFQFLLFFQDSLKAQVKLSSRILQFLRKQDIKVVGIEEETDVLKLWVLCPRVNKRNRRSKDIQVNFYRTLYLNNWILKTRCNLRKEHDSWWRRPWEVKKTNKIPVQARIKIINKNKCILLSMRKKKILWWKGWISLSRLLRMLTYMPQMI